MKTLSAWILGIFALGLALGNFVSGSGAVPELVDSERELASASETLLPDVDCGDGREALLEPINVNGATSFKVRCVDTATQTPTRVVSQAVPVVTAQEPAPVATAPQPIPVVTAPPAPDIERRETNVDTEVDEADGTRTWRESAIVIGGAAGAGAGIGALAKGKKGAAVGAAIGAAGGAAYELMKKDQKN